MPKRIHILGAPGSGKSTYSARLATKLTVPSHGLDDLYWDRASGKYGTRAAPSERDERLKQIVGQDGWIIEGVYYAWLSPSFTTADAIILLTPSVWLRHYRLLQRFISRRCDSKQVRGESVSDLWRLMRWNHRYDSQHLPKALDMVTGLGCEVIRCKHWRDVLRAMDRL